VLVGRHGRHLTGRLERKRVTRRTPHRRERGPGQKLIASLGPIGDAISGGSWSPSGNEILFGGSPDDDHRRAIFEVNADGSGLHQVPIPGCGGAFSDPKSQPELVA
jgi:hypothetical protein